MNFRIRIVYMDTDGEMKVTYTHYANVTWKEVKEREKTIRQEMEQLYTNVKTTVTEVENIGFDIW